MRNKTIFVLTSGTIGKAANECALIIKQHSKENPVSTAELVEKTQYTEGQISTIIKYMRRCSEKDLSRYIKWYPISSKKGYFFPKTFDEFAPCYATLEKWCASLHRTIAPMREKMEQEGINWKNYLPDEEQDIMENYLDEMEEMTKDKAWFYDE